MDNKQELRCWAKEKRKNISIDNNLLVKNLMQTEAYKNAKNILIFYPLKYEVNLLSLLKDKTKNFYLPKIDGESLLCCPFCDGDELCESCFKTLEPITEPCKKQMIDLVVVPALCCDKKNYRLGYGGGFYDRFLNDFCGTKIVCLPKKLLVDTVYPEEFDIPVDLVITENYM